MQNMTYRSIWVFPKKKKVYMSLRQQESDANSSYAK